MPSTAKSIDTDSSADLDLVDNAGNVIARFDDGEIETKRFRSADITKVLPESSDNADFDLSDISGNVVLRLMNGDRTWRGIWKEQT